MVGVKGGERGLELYDSESAMIFSLQCTALVSLGASLSAHRLRAAQRVQGSERICVALE